jgi:heme exporter protein D
MAIALTVLVLVALLLFIAWDRRSNLPSFQKRRLRTVATLSNEVVSARNVARAFLGIALMAAAIAVSEWLSPSARPYTGRWSWVKEALFSALGPAGPALFWVAIAIILVLAAHSVWRHTMKKPTDKLLW